MKILISNKLRKSSLDNTGKKKIILYEFKH